MLIVSSYITEWKTRYLLKLTQKFRQTTLLLNVFLLWIQSLGLNDTFKIVIGMILILIVDLTTNIK